MAGFVLSHLGRIFRWLDDGDFGIFLQRFTQTGTENFRKAMVWLKKNTASRLTWLRFTGETLISTVFILLSLPASIRRIKNILLVITRKHIIM